MEEWEGDSMEGDIGEEVGGAGREGMKAEHAEVKESEEPKPATV